MPAEAPDVTLSIVMPVFNERTSFRECLRRVLETPFRKEVIIVDDASTDGTTDLLDRVAKDHPGIVRLIRHELNRGKGAAVRTGIEHATGDIVVIQDADLEYDPRDYAQLVRPIVAGKADVVFGSRFLAGDHRVLYFWHSVGNRFLTLLSNAFTNVNLTDMETCYKAFKRHVIQNVVLESDRFGFEPEVTAKIAKSPCVIYEVPVSYHGRTYAQGKKITWRDGFAAFMHIIRFNLFRTAEACRKRSWKEVPGLIETEPTATIVHAPEQLLSTGPSGTQ
jgi:glycosyltransferase involved in cell wall biosynthesis